MTVRDKRMVPLADFDRLKKRIRDESSICREDECGWIADLLDECNAKIRVLEGNIARADWIAARVSQLLAGTDRLNYERATKRAADEYDSSAFPLE